MSYICVLLNWRHSIAYITHHNTLVCILCIIYSLFTVRTPNWRSTYLARIDIISRLFSLWFERWWGSFSRRNIVWGEVAMGKGLRPSIKKTVYSRLSSSLWKVGHTTHSGRMRQNFCNAIVKTSVLYLLLLWLQIKISDIGRHWCFIYKQLKPAKICCDWL